MLPVTVIPMVLTCLGLIALVFVHPAVVPQSLTFVTAGCGVIILVTTIAFEVPKHLALDKDGKSSALIAGLVRDNIPRTLAWTVASLVLAWMVLLLLQGTAPAAV
jgi:ABC-type spermidine/putrescine transport system permease subunit I